jgi:hypothetical protein
MAKTLGWIAVGGLGVGFASLALAYALVGRDLGNLLDRDIFLAHSCGDNRQRRRETAGAPPDMGG